MLRRTQLPGRPPLSDLCKGFVLQLLTRDVKRRLGCGGEGAEEIKNHPWFTRHAASLASVDLGAATAPEEEASAAGAWWLRVAKKEVEPTFKPKFNSDRDDDVSNFDSVFTRETKLLSESVSRSGAAAGAKAREAVKAAGGGAGAGNGAGGGAGAGGEKQGGGMDMFGFNWEKASDKEKREAEEAAARAAAEAAAKAKAADEFRGFSFAQSQSMSTAGFQSRGLQ